MKKEESSEQAKWKRWIKGKAEKFQDSWPRLNKVPVQLRWNHWKNDKYLSLKLKLGRLPGVWDSTKQSKLGKSVRQAPNYVWSGTIHGVSMCKKWGVDLVAATSKKRREKLGLPRLQWWKQDKLNSPKPGKGMTNNTLKWEQNKLDSPKNESVADTRNWERENLDSLKQCENEVDLSIQQGVKPDSAKLSPQNRLFTGKLGLWSLSEQSEFGRTVRNAPRYMWSRMVRGGRTSKKRCVDFGVAFAKQGRNVLAFSRRICWGRSDQSLLEAPKLGKDKVDAPKLEGVLYSPKQQKEMMDLEKGKLDSLKYKEGEMLSQNHEKEMPGSPVQQQEMMTYPVRDKDESSNRYDRSSDLMHSPKQSEMAKSVEGASRYVWRDKLVAGKKWWLEKTVDSVGYTRNLLRTAVVGRPYILEQIRSSFSKGKSWFKVSLLKVIFAGLSVVILYKAPHLILEDHRHRQLLNTQRELLEANKQLLQANNDLLETLKSSNK